jgi:hypothetical protein
MPGRELLVEKQVQRSQRYQRDRGGRRRKRGGKQRIESRAQEVEGENRLGQEPRSGYFSWNFTMVSMIAFLLLVILSAGGNL